MTLYIQKSKTDTLKPQDTCLKVAEKMKVVAKNVPERVEKMTKLAEENKREFIEKNIGKTFEVVIENEKDGYNLAHTKNFILCYIKPKRPLESNMVVNVKIIEPFNDGALAELV